MCCVRSTVCGEIAAWEPAEIAGRGKIVEAWRNCYGEIAQEKSTWRNRWIGEFVVEKQPRRNQHGEIAAW